MTGTDGLALATRGLRKSYGSQIALAGLDLSVPTGTVYGFLGPNGAGKTTTMRLLTGLIHPDAGSVRALGKPFGRRAAAGRRVAHRRAGRGGDLHRARGDQRLTLSSASRIRSSPYPNSLP